MSIKIGQASIDEHGHIAGGAVGDQTGREINIKVWYQHTPDPWNVYLECTDPILANKAADIFEQICNDPNYGYDQNQRWTGYFAIVSNHGKIAGAKGEFDCSSLFLAAYILAGLKAEPEGYTKTIKDILVGTGKFKAYTDAAHTSSGRYAKRGSGYLCEGHHILMVLGDGSGDKNPYKEPLLTISSGSKGDGVKWVQWELNQDGFKIDIDGNCGAITDKAIRDYQEKHGLEIDGKVGAKTRQSMR
jgi:hypothetical protein